MKKIIINYILLILGFSLISCEKEYTCVCTNTISNQKEPQEKVKTTKLGRKGFEESCLAKNSNGNNLKDCHIE